MKNYPLIITIALLIALGGYILARRVSSVLTTHRDRIDGERDSIAYFVL